MPLVCTSATCYLLAFLLITFSAIYTLPREPSQQFMANINGNSSTDLASVIRQYQTNLTVYEHFYRDVHQHPELSGMESRTAAVVASHLEALDFSVHLNIGGHGVVGLLENGPGKIVLIRAELDALPTLEQTNLPYASTKEIVDRYGNKRPVMHACGHDMNMAALLGASILLKNAKSRWSGTLITLFQPDEEETGGASAMVTDGLYSTIPVPNIMLAQHVAPLQAGLVAIRSDPVLLAADALDVRIFGGPCPGVNPQFCEDPIQIAMKVVSKLQNSVSKEFNSTDEVATVACWGSHAGVPGADFVLHTDLQLDVKTVKPTVRDKLLPFIKETIEAECIALKSPRAPIIKSRVRAPLTMDMEMTKATEDFPALQGPYDVPYAYWNFGGTKSQDAEIAVNHSPFYAPEIQPTLQSGTNAMALAVLTFLC
ncbi:hypothetical protein EAF04_000055 [Stromatinia cepivora]|nr:hypothetical protein EAF04_000055 [Stromatinia cepivora]